ncbi:protein FAR1-RELATED SEQUENCE 4-like [Nicotiana sylvestris]|uniref:protein FAR1-RELATED SEQUENCE 4-like n=1 Tax=Nicotiana sylvestris TaxID=4096 RepID=UPI00388C6E0A
MEIDMVEAQPITEEVLQTFDSIQVEGQSIKEIDNEQALGIQVLESAPVIEEVAEKTSTKLTRRRIKDSTLFKIVKIEKNLDCSVNTMKTDQKHVTSKLISGYIIDNLRDPRFEVTPAFVMAEMQKLHGLDIGYHKVWRAIQRASALIRGTPEENYELLSSYLYMMRSKKPGTYTNIKIDNNNRFDYMFYAYGSSISGWNHCRPVIAVDETFLKSKFHGVIIISVSKDANNQIFPLAFGIAESENNNSYEWYFNKHQSIAYAIAKVYPESHHEICIYHLEQNLKRRKVKSEVIKLFQTAARVYRRKEFDLYMSDIEKVDKKTYDYLMEEPPEKWARSCSP